MTKITVNTKESLYQAVAVKTDEIIVTGELIESLINLKKSQLTETERMGSDLGSGGASGIAEFALNKLFGSFKGQDKAETQNNERINYLYNISVKSPNEILLRLKQLDY